jgi:hypothetical protein
LVVAVTRNAAELDRKLNRPAGGQAKRRKRGETREQKVSDGDGDCACVHVCANG